MVVHYIYLFTVIILTITPHVLAIDCSNINGKNFTLISGDWKIVSDNAEIYFINICENSNKCSTDDAICSKDVNSNGFESMGKKSAMDTTSLNNGKSFIMNFKTTKMCGTDIYQSSITFECGKALGSPEILFNDACRVDFLWETFLACEPKAIKPVNAVKCYVYDTSNKKHDLASLIKPLGGYKVINPDYDTSDPFYSSGNNVGLYINVCQTIASSEGYTENEVFKNCPKSAAACFVASDEHSYDMGSDISPLLITDNNRLRLVYNTSVVMTENHICNGYSPSVTITFICPSGRRGASKPPLLTSSYDCSYEIEWWTEAACTDEFIKSKTCQLDSQVHGVNLDLSNLTKTTGSYEVDLNDADHTKYLLNVCHKINVECSDKTDSAMCQLSDSNPVGHSGGAADKSQLLYRDGDLSLQYKGGDTCSSNQKRTTIINFICNETAEVGTPLFTREIQCLYYFDWETKYACIAQQPTCQLTTESGTMYDISSLTRSSEQNSWEALTGSQEVGDRDRFFINVCSEVSQSASSPSLQCPRSSGVCLVSADKSTKSLGSFNHATLLENNGRLQLTYSNGDACNSDTKKIITTISLFCKPGDIETSPVYKYVTADGCSYHFDWHTAAACKLATVSGSKCALSDENSGLTFDLSRLMKPDGSYKVSSGEYDYYLNVCGPLHGTPCDTENAAACQSKHNSEMHFVTGNVSDKLSYFNGFVKLVYEHGHAYHDGTERKTQISFLCDSKAGAGSPTFLEETNHAYVFNWYTSYVCPAAEIQCMVTDPTTMEQYDLSSLAKSEDDQDSNWSVMEEDLTNIVPSTNKVKYYLNICRPVNEVFGQTASGSVKHDGCDVLTGACQTILDGNGEEHVNISNLGSVQSPPTIESPGHLLIEYSNGDVCSGSTLYKAQIHFVCRKGQLTTTPRFLDKRDCTMSFVWYTEAACPINHSTNSSNCEVVDQNSGLTFNLESLNRKKDNPYKVTDKTSGDVYQVNVCGTVAACADSNGDIYGGCQSTPSINERMKSSKQLEYSDDGVLTLTYTGDRGEHLVLSKYMISFICNRSAVAGEISFSQKSDSRTYFDFMTSLACQPEPVDCLVTDDYGNQYDLTPLARTTGSPWIAYTGNTNKLFYINVCRPITPVTGCPTGSLGACMVETIDGDKSGYNIGLVQSNPRAISDRGIFDDSTVSIIYTNGDVCKSDTKRRMSTRIIFSCSSEEGHPPVYQSTHPDSCEYLFTWQTPTACKLRATAGSNCQVTEPLYNMTFDLSSLKSRNTLTVATDTDWNFKLAVCNSLNSGDVCDKSGSCQVKKTDNTIMNDAGKSNSTLTYEDGVISISYLHGKKCHQDRFERSTIIRFTCDHGSDGNDQNPTFIDENDECTYTFDWPTKAACPPVSVVQCSYSTLLGADYDLSSLSQVHHNIEASTTGDVDGRQYFINVCRSLLHKSGELCPANSAACVKKNSKYTSLGKVSTGPALNNDGDMVLTYDHGDICDKSKLLRYRTSIVFRCSLTASEVTTPVVTMTEDHDCHLQLLWITRAACSVGSTTPKNMECSVENESTGHIFNMTSLRKPAGSYTVHDYSGSNNDFQINICGVIDNKDCPDKSASCLLTSSGQHIGAGKSPGIMSYQDGAILTTYENGDKCEANNKYNHSTVLSYVCKRTTDPFMKQPSTPTQPVYIGSDDDTCTHYISWHTFKACETHTPCAVVDSTKLAPRIIDLSPLISENGHITVISELPSRTGNYFLNLCRPLEPISGVMCPPGASVCEILENMKPKALGYISKDFQPTLQAEAKTVSIEYPSSEVCETDSSYNITTKIVLTCVPGSGKGIPRLIKVTDECLYLFEWGNDIICDDDQLLPSSGSTQTHAAGETTVAPSKSECTFKDPENDVVYDLTKIKPIYIPSTSSSSAAYNISLCNGLTSEGLCHGEAVCKTSSSVKSVLGKLNTRVIAISESSTVVLTVQFSKNQNDNSPSVKIFFYCDRDLETIDANYNDPHIVESGEILNVYWPSPHVCPPLQKRCTVVDIANMAEYDISVLSSITHHYTANDNDGNSYLINLCRPIAGDFNGCDDDATVCRKMKGSSKFSTLGVINSQKATLTTENNKHSFELRYSGGDTDVCTNKKFASVVIHFTCSKNMISYPKFSKFDKDNCVFIFTWDTHIACKDVPETVLMQEGKVIDPKTGIVLDLKDIYRRHDWIANGDVRNEPSGFAQYEYLISLSGSPDLFVLGDDTHKCTQKTIVCQKKKNFANTERIIAEVNKVKYVMTDESLEIYINSSDSCGKDSTKRSHVLITLKCSRNGGIGTPQFLYESNECGYFFEWYTDKMCEQFPTGSVSSTQVSSSSPLEVGESAIAQHNTASVVVGILIVLVIVVVLFAVFRKRERRQKFASSCKIGYWRCCGKLPDSCYRYMPVGEEGESLMNEVTEDSSLLSHINKTTARTDGAGSSAPSAVDSTDIFALPTIQIADNRRSKRSNNNTRTTKQSVKSYHDEDDVDLIDG